MRFYRDGLGLPTTRKAEEGIIFLQLQGTALALYPVEELAKDISPDFPADRSRFPGITLAYNVKTQQEVNQVIEQAKRAGAIVEKPAQPTFWGGYSGYFSDPDGYLWEVAYGAFDFNDDNSLKIT